MDPKAPEGFEFHIKHYSGEKIKRLNKRNWITWVGIWSKQDEMYVAHGVSECSLKDNPCRKTGRHKAMGRALQYFKKHYGK